MESQRQAKSGEVRGSGGYVIRSAEGRRSKARSAKTKAHSHDLEKVVDSFRKTGKAS